MSSPLGIYLHSSANEAAGPCVRLSRGQSQALGPPARALPDSARSLVFSSLAPSRAMAEMTSKINSGFYVSHVLL